MLLFIGEGRGGVMVQRGLHTVKIYSEQCLRNEHPTILEPDFACTAEPEN
jgi:hypothetical protein